MNLETNSLVLAIFLQCQDDDQYAERIENLFDLKHADILFKTDDMQMWAYYGSKTREEFDDEWSDSMGFSRRETHFETIDSPNKWNEKWGGRFSESLSNLLKA